MIQVRYGVIKFKMAKMLGYDLVNFSLFFWIHIILYKTSLS